MPCQVLAVFDCTPEGHANDSIDEEEQAQDTDDVSKGCSTQQQQAPRDKERAGEQRVVTGAHGRGAAET